MSQNYSHHLKFIENEKKQIKIKHSVNVQELFDYIHKLRFLIKWKFEKKKAETSLSWWEAEPFPSGVGNLPKENKQNVSFQIIKNWRKS